MAATVAPFGVEMMTHSRKIAFDTVALPCARNRRLNAYFRASCSRMYHATLVLLPSYTTGCRVIPACREASTERNASMSTCRTSEVIGV